MYLAHPLLDFLKKEYKLKNDAALAVALGIKPPTVSKIRSDRQNISAEMKIIIHKKTGMSIADIESFLGEDNDSGRTEV